MAYSSSEYGLAGSGASDLFSSVGSFAKVKGNRIEAASYREAAKFADFNATISQYSTEVKEAQQQRQAYQGIGTTEADIAGGGFAETGSGLDLLRSSTQQAALEHAVVGQSGQVATMGYKEQGRSFRAMADAADAAADANKIGGIGGVVTGGLKLAAFAAI